MNFLEAHKIVHDFASVVGKGCEYKDDFFISTDRLPFEFDKDRIVSALQIDSLVLYDIGVSFISPL